MASPAPDGGGSPLSGCYLLLVLSEPHRPDHRPLILQRVVKGLSSWDQRECGVNLGQELQALIDANPDGEQFKFGERLIQFATENVVAEILVNPQVYTFQQCLKNMLASFTRHRHLIHAGYVFSGNGSWILQDGTFSGSDLLDALRETDVQRVTRAYESSLTVHIHCPEEGIWRSDTLLKDPVFMASKVRMNPPDGEAAPPQVAAFREYLSGFLTPASLEDLLNPSDVVGNIRFSRPTLYVFPGGQGDAAMFGINGFNILFDGGFSRRACCWNFVRHLDRLDAVLMSRLNNGNLMGMSAMLQRKVDNATYPQVGHFFANLVDQKSSAVVDKDADPLLVNTQLEAQRLLENLKTLALKPTPCLRENSTDPINLYHKVGHGRLDLYVMNPQKDAAEMQAFLKSWTDGPDQSRVTLRVKGREFPVANLVSICCLLVWMPDDRHDTVTRLLFPGSTPQQKVFDGLDRLKHLDFMKTPVCYVKSLGVKKHKTIDTLLKSGTKAPVGGSRVERIERVEVEQKRRVRSTSRQTRNGDAADSSRKPDKAGQELLAEIKAKKQEANKERAERAPAAKPKPKPEKADHAKEARSTAVPRPKKTKVSKDDNKQADDSSDGKNGSVVSISKDDKEATPVKAKKDVSNKMIIEEKKVSRTVTKAKQAKSETKATKQVEGKTVSKVSDTKATRTADVKKGAEKGKGRQDHKAEKSTGARSRVKPPASPKHVRTIKPKSAQAIKPPATSTPKAKQSQEQDVSTMRGTGDIEEVTMAGDMLTVTKVTTEVQRFIEEVQEGDSLEQVSGDFSREIETDSLELRKVDEKIDSLKQSPTTEDSKDLRQSSEEVLRRTDIEEAVLLRGRSGSEQKTPPRPDEEQMKLTDLERASAQKKDAVKTPDEVAELPEHEALELPEHEVQHIPATEPGKNMEDIQRVMTMSHEPPTEEDTEKEKESVAEEKLASPKGEKDELNRRARESSPEELQADEPPPADVGETRDSLSQSPAHVEAGEPSPKNSRRPDEIYTSPRRDIYPIGEPYVEGGVEAETRHETVQRERAEMVVLASSTTTPSPSSPSRDRWTTEAPHLPSVDERSLEEAVPRDVSTASAVTELSTAKIEDLYGDADRAGPETLPKDVEVSEDEAKKESSAKDTADDHEKVGSDKIEKDVEIAENKTVEETPSVYQAPETCPSQEDDVHELASVIDAETFVGTKPQAEDDSKDLEKSAVLEAVEKHSPSESKPSPDVQYNNELIDAFLKEQASLVQTQAEPLELAPATSPAHDKPFGIDFDHREHVGIEKLHGAIEDDVRRSPDGSKDITETEKKGAADDLSGSRSRISPDKFERDSEVRNGHDKPSAVVEAHEKSPSHEALGQEPLASFETVSKPFAGDSPQLEDDAKHVEEPKPPETDEKHSIVEPKLSSDAQDEDEPTNAFLKEQAALVQTQAEPSEVLSPVPKSPVHEIPSSSGRDSRDQPTDDKTHETIVTDSRRSPEVLRDLAESNKLSAHDLQTDSDKTSPEMVGKDSKVADQKLHDEPLTVSQVHGKSPMQEFVIHDPLAGSEAVLRASGKDSSQPVDESKELEKSQQQEPCATRASLDLGVSQGAKDDDEPVPAFLPQQVSLAQAQRDESEPMSATKSIQEPKSLELADTVAPDASRERSDVDKQDQVVSVAVEIMDKVTSVDAKTPIPSSTENGLGLDKPKEDHDKPFEQVGTDTPGDEKTGVKDETPEEKKVPLEVPDQRITDTTLQSESTDLKSMTIDVLETVQISSITGLASSHTYELSETRREEKREKVGFDDEQQKQQVSAFFAEQVGLVRDESVGDIEKAFESQKVPAVDFAGSEMVGMSDAKTPIVKDDGEDRAPVGQHFDKKLSPQKGIAEDERPHIEHLAPDAATGTDVVQEHSPERKPTDDDAKITTDILKPVGAQEPSTTDEGKNEVSQVQTRDSPQAQPPSAFQSSVPDAGKSGVEHSTELSTTGQKDTQSEKKAQADVSLTDQTVLVRDDLPGAKIHGVLVSDMRAPGRHTLSEDNAGIDAFLAEQAELIRDTPGGIIDAKDIQVVDQSERTDSIQKLPDVVEKEPILPKVIEKQPDMKPMILGTTEQETGEVERGTTVSTVTEYQRSTETVSSSGKVDVSEPESESKGSMVSQAGEKPAEHSEQELNSTVQVKYEESPEDAFLKEQAALVIDQTQGEQDTTIKQTVPSSAITKDKPAGTVGVIQTEQISATHKITEEKPKETSISGDQLTTKELESTEITESHPYKEGTKTTEDHAVPIHIGPDMDSTKETKFEESPEETFLKEQAELMMDRVHVTEDVSAKQISPDADVAVERKAETETSKRKVSTEESQIEQQTSSSTANVSTSFSPQMMSSVSSERSETQTASLTESATSEQSVASTQPKKTSYIIEEYEVISPRRRQQYEDVEEIVTYSPKTRSRQLSETSVVSSAEEQSPRPSERQVSVERLSEETAAVMQGTISVSAEQPKPISVSVMEKKVEMAHSGRPSADHVANIEEEAVSVQMSSGRYAEPPKRDLAHTVATAVPERHTVDTDDFTSQIQTEETHVDRSITDDIAGIEEQVMLVQKSYGSYAKPPLREEGTSAAAAVPERHDVDEDDLMSQILSGKDIATDIVSSTITKDAIPGAKDISKSADDEKRVTEERAQVETKSDMEDIVKETVSCSDDRMICGGGDVSLPHKVAVDPSFDHCNLSPSSAQKEIEGTLLQIGTGMIAKSSSYETLAAAAGKLDEKPAEAKQSPKPAEESLDNILERMRTFEESMPALPQADHKIDFSPADVTAGDVQRKKSTDLSPKQEELDSDVEKAMKAQPSRLKDEDVSIGEDVGEDYATDAAGPITCKEADLGPVQGHVDTIPADSDKPTGKQTISDDKRHSDLLKTKEEDGDGISPEGRVVPDEAPTKEMPKPSHEEVSSSETPKETSQTKDLGLDDQTTDVTEKTRPTSKHIAAYPAATVRSPRRRIDDSPDMSDEELRIEEGKDRDDVSVGSVKTLPEERTMERELKTDVIKDDSSKRPGYDKKEVDQSEAKSVPSEYVSPSGHDDGATKPDSDIQAEKSESSVSVMDVAKHIESKGAVREDLTGSATGDMEWGVREESSVDKSPVTLQKDADLTTAGGPAETSDDSKQTEVYSEQTEHSIGPDDSRADDIDARSFTPAEVKSQFLETEDSMNGNAVPSTDSEGAVVYELMDAGGILSAFVPGVAERFEDLHHEDHAHHAHGSAAPGPVKQADAAPTGAVAGVAPEEQSVAPTAPPVERRDHGEGPGAAADSGEPIVTGEHPDALPAAPVDVTDGAMVGCMGWVKQETGGDEPKQVVLVAEEVRQVESKGAARRDSTDSSAEGVGWVREEATSTSGDVAEKEAVVVAEEAGQVDSNVATRRDSVGSLMEDMPVKGEASEEYFAKDGGSPESSQSGKDSAHLKDGAGHEQLEDVGTPSVIHIMETATVASDAGGGKHGKSQMEKTQEPESKDVVVAESTAQISQTKSDESSTISPSLGETVASQLKEADETTLGSTVDQLGHLTDDIIVKAESEAEKVASSISTTLSSLAKSADLTTQPPVLEGSSTTSLSGETVTSLPKEAEKTTEESTASYLGHVVHDTIVAAESEAEKVASSVSTTLSSLAESAGAGLRLTSQTAISEQPSTAPLLEESATSQPKEADQVSQESTVGYMEHIVHDALEAAESEAEKVALSISTTLSSVAESAGLTTQTTVVEQPSTSHSLDKKAAVQPKETEKTIDEFTVSHLGHVVHDVIVAAESEAEKAASTITSTLSSLAEIAGSGLGLSSQPGDSTTSVMEGHGDERGPEPTVTEKAKQVDDLHDRPGTVMGGARPPTSRSHSVPVPESATDTVREVLRHTSEGKMVTDASKPGIPSAASSTLKFPELTERISAGVPATGESVEETVSEIMGNVKTALGTGIKTVEKAVDSAAMTIEERGGAEPDTAKEGLKEVKVSVTETSDIIEEGGVDTVASVGQYIAEVSTKIDDFMSGRSKPEGADDLPDHAITAAGHPDATKQEYTSEETSRFSDRAESLFRTNGGSTLSEVKSKKEAEEQRDQVQTMTDDMKEAAADVRRTAEGTLSAVYEYITEGMPAPSGTESTTSMTDTASERIPPDNSKSSEEKPGEVTTTDSAPVTTDSAREVLDEVSHYVSGTFSSVTGTVGSVLQSAGQLLSGAVPTAAEQLEKQITLAESTGESAICPTEKVQDVTDAVVEQKGPRDQDYIQSVTSHALDEASSAITAAADTTCAAAARARESLLEAGSVAADSTEGAADGVRKKVEQTAEDAGKAVKQTMEDTRKEVEEKAKDAREAINKSADDIRKALEAEATRRDSKDLMKEEAADLQTELRQAQESTAEKADPTQNTAQVKQTDPDRSAVTGFASYVQSLGSAVADSLSGAVATAEDKVTAATTKTMSSVVELGSSVLEATEDTAKTAQEDAIRTAEEVVGRVTSAAQEKAADAGATVSTVSERVKTTMEGGLDTAASGAHDVKDEFEIATQTKEHLISDMASSAQDTGASLLSSVTQAVDQASAQTASTVDSAKGTIQAFAREAKTQAEKSLNKAEDALKSIAQKETQLAESPTKTGDKALRSGVKDLTEKADYVTAIAGDELTSSTKDIKGQIEMTAKTPDDSAKCTLKSAERQVTSTVTADDEALHDKHQDIKNEAETVVKAAGAAISDRLGYAKNQEEEAGKISDEALKTSAKEVQEQMEKVPSSTCGLLESETQSTQGKVETDTTIAMECLTSGLADIKGDAESAGKASEQAITSEIQAARDQVERSTKASEHVVSSAAKCAADMVTSACKTADEALTTEAQQTREHIDAATEAPEQALTSGVQKLEAYVTTTAKSVDEAFGDGIQDAMASVDSASNQIKSATGEAHGALSRSIQDAEDKAEATAKTAKDALKIETEGIQKQAEITTRSPEDILSSTSGDVAGTVTSTGKSAEEALATGIKHAKEHADASTAAIDKALSRRVQDVTDHATIVTKASDEVISTGIHDAKAQAQTLVSDAEDLKVRAETAAKDARGDLVKEARDVKQQGLESVTAAEDVIKGVVESIAPQIKSVTEEAVKALDSAVERIKVQAEATASTAKDEFASGIHYVKDQIETPVKSSEDVLSSAAEGVADKGVSASKAADEALTIGAQRAKNQVDTATAAAHQTLTGSVQDIKERVETATKTAGDAIVEGIQDAQAQIKAVASGIEDFKAQVDATAKTAGDAVIKEAQDTKPQAQATATTTDNTVASSVEGAATQIKSVDKEGGEVPSSGAQDVKSKTEAAAQDAGDTLQIGTKEAAKEIMKVNETLTSGVQEVEQRIKSAGEAADEACSKRAQEAGTQAQEISSSVAEVSRDIEQQAREASIRLEESASAAVPITDAHLSSTVREAEQTVNMGIEKLSQLSREADDQLNQAVQGAAKKADDSVRNVNETLSQIGKQTSDAMHDAEDVVKETGGSLASGVASLVEGVSSGLSGAESGLQAGVEQAAANVEDMAESMYQSAEDTLEEAGSSVRSTFGGLFGFGRRKSKDTKETKDSKEVETKETKESPKAEKKTGFFSKMFGRRSPEEPPKPSAEEPKEAAAEGPSPPEQRREVVEELVTRRDIHAPREEDRRSSSELSDIREEASGSSSTREPSSPRAPSSFEAVPAGAEAGDRPHPVRATLDPMTSSLHESFHDVMTGSFHEALQGSEESVGLPGVEFRQPRSPPQSLSPSINTQDGQDDEPVPGWGPPLGLPSPVPPPDHGGVQTPPPTKRAIMSRARASDSPRGGRLSGPPPVYLDLVYVPHHANSFYSGVQFFHRVRARYYVFSSIEPSREVFNALLEAKQHWEDKDLEVTIIPTYDTDTLGHWFASNEQQLEDLRIDLAPSASRCTINLQDHETSCAAYRLEF